MIKSINRFLILQLYMIDLDFCYPEKVSSCQVSIGIIGVVLHVVRYLEGMFRPLGAPEIAPVVIALVAVLPDAKVTEAEGE
jgi:hypothetical protein